MKATSGSEDTAPPVLDPEGYLKLLRSWKRELVHSCKTCDGSGQIRVGAKLDEDLFPMARACKCIAEMRRRADLYKANVPHQFWSASGKASGMADLLPASGSRDTSVVLFNMPASRDRMTLGASAVRLAIGRGLSAFWLPWSQAIREARRTWEDPAVKAWLDCAASASFLVIDGPDALVNTAARLAAVAESELGHLMERRLYNPYVTVLATSLDARGVSGWPGMQAISASVTETRRRGGGTALPAAVARGRPKAQDHSMSKNELKRRSV